MAHKKTWNSVRWQTELYLQKYRFATSAKIAKSLGCSIKTVDAAFLQLKNSGKIYIAAWSIPVAGSGDHRRVMALKQYPYQVDQPKPRRKTTVERTTKYRKKKQAAKRAARQLGVSSTPGRGVGKYRDLRPAVEVGVPPGPEA